LLRCCWTQRIGLQIDENGRSRYEATLIEELKQEACTNYARLKSGLLTDLRNDGHQLEVLVDTENVPVIFARITRYQTLRWLIEDPRVRAIHENRKIDPPGIFNGGPILRED